MYTYITESLYCTAVINTTSQINYNKNKFKLFLNIVNDQMAFSIPTQKISTGVNISFMPHSVRQESQRAKMLNFIDRFKVEL